MTDQKQVPVWTLVTEESKVAGTSALYFDETGLTPERLAVLREALSGFYETPVVTLEAHQLPRGADLSGGRLLDAASPLATHLLNLVNRTPTSTVASAAGRPAETLYRMVVPARVAAGLGQGLVRSMPSTAVAGGVHSALLSKAGIVGQAAFVPAVAEASGAGGAAVAAAGAAGVLTAAAPFVLLAVATAATLHAEQQRQRAMQRVTELLEDLHQQNLDAERDRLNGATPAITKATSILMDDGVIGHSLGLDAAVNAIDRAITTASRRADSWRANLDAFPRKGVEVTRLRKVFRGIDRPEGRFRAELRLAALAIALKRRVAVLQAVEHAQRSPGNVFPRFTAELGKEQAIVDELEGTLRQLLIDIADLRLRAPNRKFTDRILTRSEANDLLRVPVKLRQLAAEESAPIGQTAAVEIGLIPQPDGKLRVLPMSATAG